MSRASTAGVCLAALLACGAGGADVRDEATRMTPSDSAPVTVAAAGAANSPDGTPAAGAAVAAWPFAMPPLTTLRASPRRVFAHYFTPFPRSFDNRPAGQDYYDLHYLQPTGEGGKFAASGGYLRQRPLPRQSLQAADWAERDAEHEVRTAAALGLDGFALDLLASSGEHWQRARRIMDAAARVDPDFRILLMPDMEAEFKQQPERLQAVVRELAAHPAAMRLPDGRLVLAPYNAQNRAPAWWQEQLAAWRAEGLEVALWPVVQGWLRHAAAFAPISFGLSDWGVRSPGANRAWQAVPAQAQALGLRWMATVSPQDMRPKDRLYWEARNSENYRVMWEAAIHGGADWVQVVSWNDYSEATEIAPSTGTQWVFHDLTAFYVAWFKTGQPPAPTRDALMYLHRRQAAAARPLAPAALPFERAAGSDPAHDEVELLSIATAPAVAVLRLDGRELHRQAVPAGLTAVRAPLRAGRWTFTLEREGREVAAVASAYAVEERLDYPDLLYRAGSSLRAPEAAR